MGELKQEMTISIQLQNCLANEVDVQSSRVLNEQDIHKEFEYFRVSFICGHPAKDDVLWSLYE